MTPFYPRTRWAKRPVEPLVLPTYEEFWALAVQRSKARIAALRDELKSEREALKHARSMAARVAAPPPDAQPQPQGGE